MRERERESEVPMQMCMHFESDEKTLVNKQKSSLYVVVCMGEGAEVRL